MMRCVAIGVLAITGALVVGGIAGSESAGLSLEATLNPDRIAGGVAANVYAAPSAALSADGTTAIIGDPSQVQNAGTVWVFVRSGSTWSQQAKIPTPSDATGSFAAFGLTASLTPDGNTAFIGGSTSGPGAVWIYNRSGTTWTELQKIPPPDETSEFGFRIAISADGNTVAITAINNDGTNAGVYVYVRSGGSWVEQQKISYPSDSSSQVLFGTSVALSGDGNTAIVGSGIDDNRQGAYRVYTRSGSTWTEQTKISPAANEFFEYPVALSGNGDTALLSGGGKTLVYTRSGSTWTRGQELTLTGNTSVGSNLGNSLAISSDGTTAFIDGSDTSGNSFVWKFVKNGSSWTEQSATATPNNAGTLAALALSADNTRLLVSGSGAGLIYTLSSVPAKSKLVTVTVTVKGKGRISGGGISCPGTCKATLTSGSKLTLRAAPASGYRFAGWSGACSGLGVCTLHPKAAVKIVATFRKRT